MQLHVSDYWGAKPPIVCTRPENITLANVRKFSRGSQALKPVDPVTPVGIARCAAHGLTTLEFESKFETHCTCIYDTY